PSAIHPALAEDGHRLARTTEWPERAPILAADGRPLSEGRPARVIGIEPRAVTDLDALKAAFQAELGIDPAEIDAELGAPGVEPHHFVPNSTVAVPTYHPH